MNLKKRVYLLTPLLVLVCVIAAGVFMKAPVKVEAVGYLIEKGEYDAVKLTDVFELERQMSADEWAECIDSNTTNERKIEIFEENGIPVEYISYINDSENYDIKSFPTRLFDYEGDEWNKFWAYYNRNGNDSKAFAFLNANAEYNFTFNGTDVSISNATTSKDINSGGYRAKQGILQAEINPDTMLPVFDLKSKAGAASGGGNLASAMLFASDEVFEKYLEDTNNPVYKDWLNMAGYIGADGDSGINQSNVLEQIRTSYDTNFQFIFDKDAGTYTYKSSTNHAQYNKDSNTVELYADSLSVSNGTVPQISMLDISDNYTRAGEGTKNLTYANGVAEFEFSLGTSNPNICINKFIKPTGIEKTLSDDSIKKENLEYVYLKFKFDKDYFAEYASDCNLRINLASVDSPTVQYYFNSVENFSFGKQIMDTRTSDTDMDSLYTDAIRSNKNNFSCVNYRYSFTEADFKRDYIELKIPVGELYFDIESISICPLALPNAQSTYSETAMFTLYDIGFGYNYYENATDYVFDNSGNKQNVIAKDADAGFYPFMKIENSYDGEKTGGGDISTLLNRTKDQLNDNSSSFKGSRGYFTTYTGGLDSVVENDIGGSGAHFGMATEIEFFMPNDKKTDKNQDITFRFNGDDDLWVFIDDYLVMDIGGNHVPAGGTINLTQGFVEYNGAVVQNITSGNPTSNVAKDGTNGFDADKLKNSLGTATLVSGLEGKNKLVSGSTLTAEEIQGIFYGNYITYYTSDQTSGQNKVELESILTPGEHTLRIFYLERASGASNCYIQFNLPQIPEGGITVSAEAESADSNYELPADFNGDGVIDSEAIVSSKEIKDGENVYKELCFVDEAGNVLEKPSLLIYEYYSEYSIPKSYVEAGLYKGTYQLYKTSDLTADAISGLKLTQESCEEEVIGTETYYTYKVKFSVPMGYTATIFIPDDSIVRMVEEVNPVDYEVTQEFAYLDTSFVLGINHFTAESVTDVVSLPIESQLGYYLKGGEIDGYEYEQILIGSDTKDVESVKYNFTNFYKPNRYDIKIEKKFEKDSPVPVGQSILFKIEGGSFAENPMYVSMVIQAVSDGNNPNVITIKDVLGGTYTITEVTDWSWRYECYDIEVQRSNDSQNLGEGTIIGVSPAPYKD